MFVRFIPGQRLQYLPPRAFLFKQLKTRTLLLRIFCTGSESSNTTKPKFGSFPPLLILSSRTVPYSAGAQQHVNHGLQQVPTSCVTSGFFKSSFRRYTMTVKGVSQPLQTQLTFKEFFEFIFVHVMRDVAHEQLVGVGVPGHPAALRLPLLPFPS